MDMKRGLNSPQHSGSVHVTFNVSDDVASHIRQSVVSSWRRMQELGVVSIQLDKEQLMHDNCGLYTESSKVRSTELQHCTQLSHRVNGYTDFEQVLDSCYKSSRRGTTRRRSGSRLSKRMRNDDSSCQFTGRELCSSTASAKLVFQEGMSCELGGIACRRLSQIKEVAGSSGSEHVSPAYDRRMFSLQLPNHMSSNIAFGGTAASTDRCAVPTENQFVAQPKLDELGSAITLNTMQSYDLPPPSTPFVPKRRKRRKPVDRSSETVSAKVPSCTAVNCMNHTALPIHVNGSIKAMPNLFWQNYTDRRFQLNGHYPRQFSLPVVDQCVVSNAQLVPLSCAGSQHTVALANYAQLPAERQMVLDSGVTVGKGVALLPSATAKPENASIVLAKRDITASSSQQLQLGLSVSYPSLDRRGQLCQPLVPALSRACSPKLSNLSQGTLESRHRNPETHAATGAETNVVDCAERFCSSENSHLCALSTPLPTERNLCSKTSTSSTPLEIKPSETQSLCSSEMSRLDCTEPVPELLATASSNSVDVTASIQSTLALASAITTASVCCSSKNVNLVVQSDTVHSSHAASSSAALRKHKPVGVNGYHFTLDCSPAEARHESRVPVPCTVPQTVHDTDFHLSTSASQDTGTKHYIQTAVDHSSVTVLTPAGEASQVAFMQTHGKFVQFVSSVENSQSVSDW